MVRKVERGAGKGPNVEFGAGVDEECRRRASAEGEKDRVCNVVVDLVANVTKGTVAMSLGTRVYRISDLGAVLFDENENDHPQHSVGGKQLQMLFDEGGKRYDAWVAGHTANKSGPRGGFSARLAV